MAPEARTESRTSGLMSVSAEPHPYSCHTLDHCYLSFSSLTLGESAFLVPWSLHLAPVSCVVSPVCGEASPLPLSPKAICEYKTGPPSRQAWKGPSHSPIM